MRPIKAIQVVSAVRPLIEEDPLVGSINGQVFADVMCRFRSAESWYFPPQRAVQALGYAEATACTGTGIFSRCFPYNVEIRNSQGSVVQTAKPAHAPAQYCTTAPGPNEAKIYAMVGKPSGATQWHFVYVVYDESLMAYEAARVLLQADDQSYWVTANLPTAVQKGAVDILAIAVGWAVDYTTSI